MHIREAEYTDLKALLDLYAHLHDNPIPDLKNKHILNLWNNIIQDAKQHILVVEQDGKVVSSCTLTIILNLTHEQSPYALIENVVTDMNYRGKGFATCVLNVAKQIAKKEHCYKMMLLTGSKEESTLNFYKKAGYNSHDKTAFIQWL